MLTSFSSATKASLWTKEIVIEAVKNHQSNKTSADNQEVLTSVVTETIERTINEKLKVSPVPTGGQQELPTENKEIPNRRLVEDNDVRIRGIEESKKWGPEKKGLSDRSERNAIRSFLKINTQINDCRRLSTYEENKCRPILIKLDNSWDKSILLMSIKTTEL